MKETGKNILIVDPAADRRKDLSLVLRQAGYHVTPCSRLKTILRRPDLSQYACAIVDVQQSGMKGYEAVPVLKSKNREIKIIITSEKNSKALEAKIRDQDIYYYHIRSFDLKELNLAVQNIFYRQDEKTEQKMKNEPVRILIIDDDRDYADAIRILLENNHFRINMAHTREEAMEKIRQFNPDLIILDIMMERMTDGFTICYQLKHNPELKKIPVMVVSAITEETGLKFSPETDGSYFQADDYAQKPVEPEELLQRIGKLLHQ